MSDELGPDLRACLLAQGDARALAALARVDDGAYGLCVRCGDALAADALAVDPCLARCVACEAEARRARADARFGVCGVKPR